MAKRKKPGRPKGATSKFTPEARKVFLETYAKTMSVQASCDAAGFHYLTYRKHFREDPGFMAEVEEAKRRHYDLVEQEVFRRGVLGWDEPKFGANGQVGTIRRYSDRMLELYAQRRIPAYRSNQSAKLELLQTNNFMQINNTVKLDELPEESRKHLRALLSSAPEEAPEPAKGPSIKHISSYEDPQNMQVDVDYELTEVDQKDDNV